MLGGGGRHLNSIFGLRGGQEFEQTNPQKFKCLGVDVEALK